MRQPVFVAVLLLKYLVVVLEYPLPPRAAPIGLLRLQPPRGHDDLDEARGDLLAHQVVARGRQVDVVIPVGLALLGSEGPEGDRGIEVEREASRAKVSQSVTKDRRTGVVKFVYGSLTNSPADALVSAHSARPAAP